MSSKKMSDYFFIKISPNFCFVLFHLYCSNLLTHIPNVNTNNKISFSSACCLFILSGDYCNMESDGKELPYKHVGSDGMVFLGR